jgi:TorA maturation chaperone TorD
MSPVIENKIPHFVLASILTSYPGNLDLGFLRILIDEGVPDFPQPLRIFVDRALGDPEEMLSLGSEYIDLFDRGRSRNPPNETEYGRDRAMAKGNDLADIAGFYSAFGFGISESADFREMVDHIAVELEFYALLLMKQEQLSADDDESGVEIVRDARQKFLLAHLGRFIDALADRPGVKDSPFFGPLLVWVRDLVHEECADLGVSPAKVTWTASSPPEMSCGGSACETI